MSLPPRRSQRLSEKRKIKSESKTAIVIDTLKKNDEIGSIHESIRSQRSQQSHYSTKSNANSAIVRRQKLEAQLEYERQKIEKEEALLNLEYQLKLAKIDEEVEVQEDILVQDNPSFIENWINDQQTITDKNDTLPVEHNKDATFSNFISRQSLPKELPIFQGDPIDWPNFICQYRNSTKICGFTNEENQSRLQKCLKGKAKDIVQSLLILPQNVPKAMSILEKRFGRPEYIISLLIDKVKKLNVLKDDKLDPLIDFSDAITNFVYTIQTLNEEDHLRNPLLLQELVSKLPTNYKMMWAEHLQTLRNACIKLEEFQIWLEKKAEAACLVRIPKLEDKIDMSKFKNHKYIKDSTLVMTNKGTTVQNLCLGCNLGNHHLSNCEKFKLKDIDSRWQMVTSKRICFSCLQSGHGVTTCKQRKGCNINGCQKPHHPLLHKDLAPKIQGKGETNCHISQPTNKVLLKILPVTLKNKEFSIETFALLDDASTVTILDHDIATKLNLDRPTYPLCMQWTNNEVQQQDDSKIVNVTISGQNKKSFYLRHVRTIKGLSLPSQTINLQEMSDKYPNLLKSKCSTITDAKPTILIGQNNWPLLLSKKVFYGSWSGSALSKTLLGWVIHGNTEQKFQFNHQQYTCHIHEKDEIDILHDMVKQQWKLESFGVKPLNIDRPMSKEDVRAQLILNSTMKRLDNRYETGLLWKHDNIELPESKSTAFRRLRLTEQKMDKNSEYAKAYCDKIQDIMAKGYLKKLSQEEANISNSKTWYLPHFGVVNQNKSNKIRIVFDAASKSNNVSLNDNLLSGPDLYNSLSTILLNFRIKKIAFVADIKEMFLQVKIIKDDRCAQRLLWRGMDRNKPADVYEIQVVFFGSTCGPCLAQEAKNKNARHFIEKYPEAANAIIKHHYMDDYLGGADSESEAIKLINEVIHVHQKGGFVICNWITNSKNVLEQIDPKLTASGEKNMNMEAKISMERVLGLWWNPAQDNFCFQTKFHKIDKSIINGQR